MKTSSYKSTARLTAGILTGLALTGCSQLADEQSSPPPIATITGTLTLPSGADLPEGTLRVALLWHTAESVNISDDWGGECGPSEKFLEYAEQSIELDPSFPNQFVLNLTAPPPAAAMLAREEGGPLIAAEGRIVVYVDGDDDGQLDVRLDGATSPDYVLATSEPELWRTYESTDDLQYEVTYFTEPHSVPNGASSIDFPVGFSLQRYRLESFDILPIETPIELRLTGAPYLQDLLCERICNDWSTEYACPASLSELPEAPNEATAFLSGNARAPGWGYASGEAGHTTLRAYCSGDSFVWSRRTCEGCACHEDSCVYEKDNVAPAEWPCGD